MYLTSSSVKTIYLTFNDSPSGIFKSQVIDRVNYLNKLGYSIQLITFLPLLNFQQNKRIVLNWLPQAIVLKQLPGLKYWWVNLILLIPEMLRLKPKRIIGRSIYATNLGLIIRKLKLVKEVIYDGRGAITAECEEFKMVPIKWLPSIKKLEWKAINLADRQLTVSNALEKYWKKEFSYIEKKAIVIPCTLGEHFESLDISEQTVTEARKKIGFSNTDIILAYSGSLAGWQFRKGLDLELAEWLRKRPANKLLFLCREDERINALQNDFPNQVARYFLPPEEVPKYLIGADYGLLVRVDLVTNRVASPVKFAEYLACGLKVIISENIGDYSNLVKSKHLGIVINSQFTFGSIRFMLNHILDRKKINHLANKNFRTDKKIKRIFNE